MMQTRPQSQLMWGLVVMSLWLELFGVAVRQLVPWALTRRFGPLPSYALQLGGSDSCLRCQSTAVTTVERDTPAMRVRLDAPLDVRLHPARPAVGPVSVRAFVQHGRQLRRWPIVMERATDGTLRLRGLARDLLDLDRSELGVYELVFALQRSPLGGPPAQTLRGAVEVLPPLTPVP